MKKSRIGILLLTPALILLTLTGCMRNRIDKNDQETTKDNGSPLIPTPGATLPGEDGETSPQTTEETRVPNESNQESVTGSETTQQESATTTTKQETTSKTETTTTKQETTTKKPETTTTKSETTTKKPETTTKKPETTTAKQETTTNKPETTTTKKPETTTTKQETTTHPETPTTKQETSNTTRETDELPPIVTPDPNESMTNPILPNESITLPIPGESSSATTNESTSQSTSQSTTKAESGSQTTAPEIGAGEWLHFEAFEDEHAGAAAYLGRSTQELPVTDIIEHFHLPLTEADITVIDHGDSEDSDGDAWYLILPRYRDTVVRIREAEQTGRRTRSGELIAEGMHPMLIRCDPEDGEPSIYVEMIRGEETISFALRLEQTSGKPIFHDRVLNITPSSARSAIR